MCINTEKTSLNHLVAAVIEHLLDNLKQMCSPPKTSVNHLQVYHHAVQKQCGSFKSNYINF